MVHPFKNLPFFSALNTKEYIGIYCSASRLKIAHVQAVFNKKELAHLASHSIAGAAENDLVKIIKRSFDECKAKNPDVLCIIPAQAVITKNIEIPSTEAREIKEIINLQAGRHTPYSREEIIVDYIDLGAYKNSYTKILLVIITANSIKKQLDLLDKAGIKAKRVVFAMEGMACFLQKILQVESNSFPVALIHIDEGWTDFAVIARNKPVFLRNIPIGAECLIQEKEKYEAKFIEELKKSLEAYQSEDIEKMPQLVAVTGATEELTDWQPALQAAFYMPIKYVSYFKSEIITPAFFRQAAGITKKVSFLDVIAPLFAREEIKVELIPEEVRLKASLEERGRELIKTGILIFAIFILIFFLCLSMLYGKNSYVQKLGEKYRQLNQEAQELRKDSDKNDLIKKYVLHHGVSVELLAVLYEIVPIEAELNDIRFEKQGKFLIRGAAASRSTVYDLEDAMRKSKYFTEIKIGQTSSRKEGAKDVIDFEITSSIAARAD